ncbi:MAG: helix-turn-helix transcriptional regulator [Methylocella sp.]
MSGKDILNKIANLPVGPLDIPQVPPRELIGFVVRWERGLRQWKLSTLANFAGVSVSTIERVERGEKVSDTALDRIAQGLGYEPGRFTAPRYRLGPEQAAASLVETFREMEPVAVAPMNTHRQVREAASCRALVLSGVVNTPQEGIPDWKVAVISVTPRFSDPGASKRRLIFVDHRLVALPPLRTQ